MKEFQGVICVGDQFMPLCTVKATDEQDAVIAVAAELAKNPKRLGFLRLWSEHGCKVSSTKHHMTPTHSDTFDKKLSHRYFKCNIIAHYEEVGYLRFEPDIDDELDYTPEMRDMIKVWCALNSRPCNADAYEFTLHKFYTSPFSFIV